MPASFNSAAEHIYRQFYERFLNSFPLETALAGQVRKWILEWFALDDVYMNDIAVPKFVGHLSLSGQGLRKLSDLAILQYLSIQNVRLYGGPDGQLYPAFVIEKLVADILEARRRAIPGWNGVNVSPKQGKRKRSATKNAGSNKRVKPTHTCISDSDRVKDTTVAEHGAGSGRGEKNSSRRGHGGSPKRKGGDQAELMDADTELLLVIENNSDPMRETGLAQVKDQLSILLPDAESGHQFSLTSLMGSAIPSENGKRKQESAEQAGSIGDWPEGETANFTELITKMKRFKQVDIRDSLSELDELPVQERQKGQSA